MNAGEVRRGTAGFEAITGADRAALRRAGANPPWAITVALSIAAAERAGHGLDDTKYPEALPPSVSDSNHLT